MKKELLKIIAAELNLKQSQVKGTVNLFDEGNTVPFIARYRKEVTGGLTETEIRKIEERMAYLRNLEERKEEVIRLIDEQDKLTEELEEKIRAAVILQEVEDLYRPYRQKRHTRASKAREKGLEPLAILIREQSVLEGNPVQEAEKYLNPDVELENAEDVFQGARDIVAGMVSDDAAIRKKVRKLTLDNGLLTAKLRDSEDQELDAEGKFQIYYDYKEAVRKLPPHRILAINRGEKEEVLQIKVEASETEIRALIERELVSEPDSIFHEQLLLAIEDAYKRLIAPSIEREIRNQLTEKAEEQALRVFSKNLRSLLLQPPLKDQVVMGIDPGFRTGSKAAVVDETGKLLDTATIYPHPPQKDLSGAREVIKKLVKEHGVTSIAIGNGTASRETEFFIAEIIKESKGELAYTIVDEAGASVYSASELAREEFPELDVSMRGAVSIARRLQDPLAELVKIEPRSIGVGLYQHDINPGRLEENLARVVESAVNYVGVDLNTASPSLLAYVAGINNSVARNIVKHREENGPFKRRKELREVYRLGEKTFIQAAGFLRLNSPEDPLSITPIHPETYGQTRKLLEGLGYQPAVLHKKDKFKELRVKLNEIDLIDMAEELEIGVPTLKDIIAALKKPGRDPREELPKPVFRTDVLKLSDLKPEMLLQGTVRNVVDFGAFVDIGLKEDGLVHISELSHNYVKDPLEVVQVGDVVKVKILAVDEQRKRISLSMKL